MTFKFATAVGGADPGNQFMAMNSAVYSAVTVLVFDEQTSTNFEASTILSLLRAGNRVYLQQSDDATKAAVYEVTAPATDNGTYWSVPVTFIAKGASTAMFGANKVVTSVFILSSSSVSVANPTATIGLTTINGSATTAMRSDAAPALSQAISPTWSGSHTFVNQITALANIQANGSIISINAAGTGPTVGAHVSGVEGIYLVANNSGGTVVGMPNGGYGLATLAGSNISFCLNGIIRAQSTPTGFYTSGAFRSDGGLVNTGGTLTLVPNPGGGSGLTYGTYYVEGAVGSYHGIAVKDGTLNPTLMSSGSAAGVYLQGEAKWLILRGAGSVAITQFPLTATSFYTETATSGNMGAGTVNATAYYVNGVALASGPSPGTPGNFLGLTVNNGTASTYMRSDATPPLSQSIVPTWTGLHTFTYGSITINGASGAAAVTFGSRNALSTNNNSDTYLRINDGNAFTAGVYTGGEIRAAGRIRSDLGIGDTSTLRSIQPNLSTLTYGGWLAVGNTGAFSGIAAYDAVFNPTLMANGTDSAGIYVQGESKWLITRNTSTTGYTHYNLSAPSFTTTSSRDIKRETGRPRYAADILARLRPLLYRLLADDDREQLGLIAEEVNAVCPQLSDGKTVAYDRLAILLLSAWQDEHALAVA
jgi:hypothetical protein